jgi:hypothetical protein
MEHKKRRKITIVDDIVLDRLRMGINMQESQSTGGTSEISGQVQEPAEYIDAVSTQCAQVVPGCGSPGSSGIKPSEAEGHTGQLTRRTPPGNEEISCKKRCFDDLHLDKKRLQKFDDLEVDRRRIARKLQADGRILSPTGHDAVALIVLPEHEDAIIALGMSASASHSVAQDAQEAQDAPT